MNRPSPFLSLLAAAARGAAEDERAAARIAARVAWVKEVMARLRAAQKRADDAWMRAVCALPEDHSDEELNAIPEPPEQAELDAIRAQVDAVVEEDKWPAHLYWGDV
jgi:hypothetical protein